MLIIAIYKISNVIAKSRRDHQGSQSEQLWTLVTFQAGVSVSSNKRPPVVWLTAASQRFQKARVANFPTSLSFHSCVTIGRESSFHSACSVLYCACFQSSDKTYTMLLPRMCREGMNEVTDPDIQGSGSSKESNYKKGIHNLVTSPGVQNFLWMLARRSKCLVAHTYKLCHTTFICMKY